MIWGLLLAALLCLAACDQPPVSQQSCSHADQDNNGICDICTANLLVTIDIYAINDLHGRFSDTDNQPGLDELSSYLEAMDDQTTVLLSSGDMWQGTAESSLTYGALMTEWMNEMAFTSMTLGNHEFDWGTDYVRANSELADFPFLAINIYDRTTREPVDYCQSSILIERSGIQIGIIGAIGDCYSSIAPDQVRDIYFKTGNELTALVKEESEFLRSMGADIIVYAIHGGGTGGLSGLQEYYDPCLSQGYVDVVFEGHSHRSYCFEDAYGVAHIQGGAENQGISHASIVCNRVTGEHDIQGSYIPNYIYKNSPSSSIPAELLEKYREDIAKADQSLGHNGSLLDGSYLRDLVAKLYYETGAARWGSEYDIAIGGGFISIRSPGRLTPGNVLYDDLYTLFPFDNELVLCSVSGADLIQNFLETDNKNYFVYSQSLGEIDPNGIYYIVVDTYTSTYPPNNLTEIQRYGEALYARDLLAAYISAGHLAGEDKPEPYQLTDIPALLDICGQLKANRVSQEYYYTMGKIIHIDNRTYGNMTIEDDDGNRLYIYGVNASDGTRYDAMPAPPQVGDTVVLYGQMKKYVPASGEPILEMIYAELITQECSAVP